MSSPQEQHRHVSRTARPVASGTPPARTLASRSLIAALAACAAALAPAGFTPMTALAAPVDPPPTVPSAIPSLPGGTATLVVPQSPTYQDEPGTDHDTYTLPKQDGVLWSVNGVGIEEGRYGIPLPSPIAQGGRLHVVASPAEGYQFDPDAETEFHLRVIVDYVPPEPTVTATLRDGWKADVEWGLTPESMKTHEGDVTYTVTYAPLTLRPGGSQTLGPEKIWFEDTTRTKGLFSAWWGLAFRITVVATDTRGMSGEASVDVGFPIVGPVAELTDLTPSTAALSPGWYFATGVSESRYFGRTALVTARNGATARWTVSGARTMDLVGTYYPAGGKALIRVDGRNWAWLDSGSPTVSYQGVLRRINLPTTGAHTVTVIAVIGRGQELALDRYSTIA